MLTTPSSNLGISGASAPIAAKVSIAVIAFLESVYFAINDSSDGRFSCRDYSARETSATPTFGTRSSCAKLTVLYAIWGARRRSGNRQAKTTLARCAFPQFRALRIALPRREAAAALRKRPNAYKTVDFVRRDHLSHKSDGFVRSGCSAPPEPGCRAWCLPPQLGALGTHILQRNLKQLQIAFPELCLALRLHIGSIARQPGQDVLVNKSRRLCRHGAALL